MTLSSERGRILPPNLDDRTWQNLVDEMRGLIPRYAPRWTDQNPSDLGITLIELFAWLVESLTYRLNRVPEKNYIAFLRLLGITRNPAVPAGLFLTFEAQGQQRAVLVPRGTQAQTQGNETEAPTVFETDDDMLVLPTTMKIALELRDVGEQTPGYKDISQSLTVPPAAGIALDLLPPGNVQLCLGFEQAVSAEILLRIKLFSPLQLVGGQAGDTASAPVSVSWVYSTGETTPLSWSSIPDDRIIDGTQNLEHDGIVRLTVPADWTSQNPDAWQASSANPVTIPYYWLGVRFHTTNVEHVKIGFNYILFNAVSAHNALTIRDPEFSGESNGQAFQVFQLQHYPLFKQTDTDTPYNHLIIEVDNVTWTLVDDFPAGPGNFYRLDPVAGEVSFGSFDPVGGQGHGSIPPRQSRVVARTYRYVVGGLSGNVGGGQVNLMRTPVTGITSVINLAASFGAADQEPLADTMRLAPEMLKNRDRAVTFDDYEFLTREATTAVALTRCLIPRLHNDDRPWLYGGIDRAPGNVNVVIVPDQGQEVATPEPATSLLHEVLQYLDKRRDVTAHLSVIGPRYLPIKGHVTAILWQRATESTEELKKELEDRLKRYFHPILGGPEGQGWSVGQSVYLADLYKALQIDSNLGYVQTLTIEAGEPLYLPSDRPPGLLTSGSLVQLADYELVCLGEWEVVVNELLVSR